MLSQAPQQNGVKEKLREFLDSFNLTPNQPHRVRERDRDRDRQTDRRDRQSERLETDRRTGRVGI